MTFFLLTLNFTMRYINWFFFFKHLSHLSQYRNRSFSFWVVSTRKSFETFGFPRRIFDNIPIKKLNVAIGGSVSVWIWRQKCRWRLLWRFILEMGRTALGCHALDTEVHRGRGRIMLASTFTDIKEFVLRIFTRTRAFFGWLRILNRLI